MESVVAAGTIFLGQVTKKEKLLRYNSENEPDAVQLSFFSLFSDGVSDSGPAVYQQVNALRDPRVNYSGLGWHLWDHVCCVHRPRGEEPCVRLLKTTFFRFFQKAHD